MNRRVFAAQIARVTGHTGSTVEAILEAAILTLATELARAGRFEWRGLGTFTVRAHASRQIHNPATGQMMSLPSRKTVAFKPSSNLKTKLKPPAPTRFRKRSR